MRKDKLSGKARPWKNLKKRHGSGRTRLVLRRGRPNCHRPLGCLEFEGHRLHGGTVEKGQKVTFAQVKTVDSRVWLHVRRAGDDAEGWFPNGTEYEDRLPFARFMQAG